MDNEKGPLTWLKKQLGTKDGPPGKKSGKYQYLMIVVLFGAAIMIVGNILGDQNPSNAVVPAMKENETEEDAAVFGQKKTAGNDVISEYEEAYEAQLTEMLEGINGVGDVTVFVNIDATEKKVLEKNTVIQSQTTDETDREGGKRKVEDASKDEQLVIIRNGEKEVPIVLETKKPEIRGVLVVAKGAENIQVKKWITEAVTKALDVPNHRVAVMPKKSKGD
ncbi:stage III sporulation protein AG [Mesobacillus subterraneus]|uniref:stage III sporulation protein AG n=1 Tax=Mesobacillus subterraneus TaxID=285983 RepID=UPI00203C228F|nr:stage III sporulation protein AG [Mesobacillus subterraneus]MCM3665448.1 stage III sporulation protein AG [Mesobacillus subterraneus]MCM3684545.1 stage III sporulation protein AG [Mesobacillus subterraneus]